MQRTTILLDASSRTAAKRLAARLDVTPSEVIRRALVHYDEHLMGGSAQARQRRLRALERAFELFEGMDVDDEIARMKREDASW